TPEMVATYFRAVAEHVREILASLGLRSVGEAVGRPALLRQRQAKDDGGVDLSAMLREPPGHRRFVGPVPIQRLRSVLGDRLYHDAWPAVAAGGQVDLSYPVSTDDRSVGARLGGEIGREFGPAGSPGTARVVFRGSAGLS